MGSATPKALALDKLRSSGLDETDLKKLKMEALSDVAVLKLSPKFKRRPGLKIPYFYVNGKDRDFYRLRYLGDSIGDFGSSPADALRYVQLENTGTAAYFPRTMNWAEALKPKRPIFITEGELKAACACKRGIPTIGLGGVFNFQAARVGQALIPELASIDWVQRPTNIVFDSDYQTNPNIRLALRRFTNLIIQHGGQPRVIALPELDGPDTKVGLDDFLVRESLEAFHALCKATLESEVSRTLWEWNEKFGFVKDPALVIDLKSGQRMKTQTFEKEVYRNHHIQMVVEKDDANVFKKVSTASTWLEWEHRSELDNITYRPGLGRIVDNSYNLWQSWGSESKKGDLKPWSKFLAHLFPEPEILKWFNRWCAYPIQYPGVKLFTAVVLWSKWHGVGKSFIGETIGRIYGPDNSILIGQDELESSFNGWAQGKQFVFGDDVTGSDNRTYADKLKKMITQPTIRINEKYVPPFNIPDCVNYFFTSNKGNAFFIEDHDRRYFVHEVKIPPLDRDFYEKLVEWREGGGVAALRYEYEHLDLGSFDPYAQAMMTKSKEQAIEESKSDVAVWLADLRVNEKISPMPDLVTAQQVLAEYARTTGQLRLTVNGMARELGRAGFVKVNQDSNVYVFEKGARYWMLRNEDKWSNASATLCREYLEKVTIKPSKDARY